MENQWFCNRDTRDADRDDRDAVMVWGPRAYRRFCHGFQEKIFKKNKNHKKIVKQTKISKKNQNPKKNKKKLKNINKQNKNPANFGGVTVLSRFFEVKKCKIIGFPLVL